jgi:hypothetical protein
MIIIIIIISKFCTRKPDEHISNLDIFTGFTRKLKITQMGKHLHY